MFGKSNKNSGAVDGIVTDSDGNAYYALRGTWNEGMEYCPINDAKDSFDESNASQLWKIKELPDNWERNYQFTKFGLQMNYLTDNLKKMLPPTDSRYRPDQRALENGDLTLANSEKHRLEEKQRAARKEREKENIEWEPNYFEEYDDEFAGIKMFRFNGKYWTDRKNKNWGHLPDLYSAD